MNASLENVLNINTTHWRIPDALGNAQALNSSTKVRKKVGSVLHLYCPIGWTAHDLRMAEMDVVRVPSGGRDQIGRLTAVRRGHGRAPMAAAPAHPATALSDAHDGRPWWTRRWKTLKRRPSI
jgi:hypothetical protein